MAQEILISINVNSGKAEANLGNAKQSVDKLAAAQKRLKEAESATAVEIAKVNIQTKEQIALNNQAAAALLKNTQNGSKQFRTQVGLNNAILQEAGRAASDARFGFNGVANNVGQLASLFGSLINTSDNVVTSLKNLGKSLLGTGGILIAVQLLIAYGDRIYAFFFETDAAASKLKSTMEGLVKPIKENRLELLGYVDVLKDVTSSEEARLEAINAISDVVPDAIDDNGNLKLSYDNLTDSVEDYINQLLIRAEIEAIIDLNAETFSRKRKLREIDSIKDTDKRSEAINSLLKEEANFYDGVVAGSELIKARSVVAKDAAENDVRTEEEKNRDLIRNIEKYNKELDDSDNKRIKIKSQSDAQLSKLKVDQTEADFQTFLKASEIEADAILKSVVDLQKKLKGVRDEDEYKGNKRGLREFQEGLFRIQRLIDRYNEEADKINVRTLDEKLDLEEEYAKREADSKLKNFEEQQAKRLEEYKERVKGAKNAGELIANAELDYQNSIEDAKIKHGEAILAIEDGIITKRILAKDKEAQAIGRIERSIEDAEIDRLRFSIGANEEYFNKKLEQVGKDKENVDAQIANADTLKLSDLEVAELRKQSFALQNQQIDLNLDKEISSIKAKQAINMEYVGFAKGISQLMGTLAGENEALQKAALIVEKGAAIADIVIKTQAANAVTIAQDTASLGATIPITTPLRLRNNISAGISIANILATTIASFRKPSASGGGASAASAPVQAPDFNVVGTSSVDQLAQTVAGQTNEPIKAYVVGKDVTNQQELDRNIVNTAGI